MGKNGLFSKQGSTSTFRSLEKEYFLSFSILDKPFKDSQDQGQQVCRTWDRTPQRGHPGQNREHRTMRIWQQIQDSTEKRVGDKTPGAGQLRNRELGQECLDRTAGMAWYRQDTKERTGGPEPDSKDRKTGRTPVARQPWQHIPGRRSRSWTMGQDSRDSSAWQFSLDRSARTGQTGCDIKDRTTGRVGQGQACWTGQLGQATCRTAGTGQPGKDSQDGQMGQSCRRRQLG